MSARPLPGSWKDLVVFAAGTAWDGQRGSDQHMAEQLSHFGPVLYVDPPVSHRAASRNPHLAEARREPLRLLRPGLARLTPSGLPGAQRRGIYRVNLALLRHAINTAVRALDATVAATVVSSLDDVFGATRTGARVLYGTDDYVAGAALMGIDADRLRRDERAQLARADRVIAVTDVLADRWRALGADPVVIPNGVDCDAFANVDDAAWPDDVDLPAPIAGFVGFVSDRIDFDYLDAVAARGCSLLLVGPTPANFASGRLDALRRRPNVRWVGGKPFSVLPRYLRAIDVGLTPYGVTDFNRASFPLKTLEYLAAGRAAVTTDLPAIRTLGTDLITVAQSPEEFGAAVAQALGQTPTPGDRSRRRAFAQQHSWAIRGAEVAEIVRPSNANASKSSSSERVT